MRLDLKVKEKLGISRQKAAELIKNGCVLADGKPVLKPSFEVTEAEVDIINEDSVLRYVSRGGYKLEGALDAVKFDLQDKVCLDIGSSTGGFTDCMLQRGASEVYCVDVGSDQLHPFLKNDKRVHLFENTDIREFSEKKPDILFDFAASDVSFISAEHIVTDVFKLLKPGGKAVLLIKPQFELDRSALNSKGIVKDKRLRFRAVKNFVRYCSDAGLYPVKLLPSPIRGGDGNREYLYICSKTKTQLPSDEALKELTDD